MVRESSSFTKCAMHVMEKDSFCSFSPYEGCPLLTSQTALCEGFPEGAECKCPMPKGVYNFVDVEVEVPDMGVVFNTLMLVSQ